LTSIAVYAIIVVTVNVVLCHNLDLAPNQEKIVHKRKGDEAT